MPKVILPNKSRSASDPNLFSDVYENDEALKEVIEELAEELADAKPTAGVVAASEDLTLTGSYKDIPGAVLNITPAVPSKLIVTAYFDFQIDSSSGITAADLNGTVKLDNEAEQSRVAHPEFRLFETGGSALLRGQSSVAYEFSLSAGAHTVKMRAKRVTENALTPKVLSLGSHLQYLLLPV